MQRELINVTLEKRKERKVHLLLSKSNMIVFLKIQAPHLKITKIYEKFNKVTGFKRNTQKSMVFPYTSNNHI